MSVVSKMTVCKKNSCNSQDDSLQEKHLQDDSLQDKVMNAEHEAQFSLILNDMWMKIIIGNT